MENNPLLLTLIFSFEPFPHASGLMEVGATQCISPSMAKENPHKKKQNQLLYKASNLAKMGRASANQPYTTRTRVLCIRVQKQSLVKQEL